MLRCVSKLLGVQDTPLGQMATVQGCSNSHCRDSLVCVGCYRPTAAHVSYVRPTVPGPATEKWLMRQNDRAGIAFGSAGEWSCAPMNLRPFLVVL